MVAFPHLAPSRAESSDSDDPDEESSSWCLVDDPIVVRALKSHVFRIERDL